MTPLFINPDDARYRETANELFETHVGEPKADLDTAIDLLMVADTDYKTIQGLAKLLRDKYDFETVAAAEPRECSGSKLVSMSRCGRPRREVCNFRPSLLILE
ncbi:hypothetical protein GCM10008985_04660 [Halococcus dombrowskii]|uniref:Uncharacterized protein n=1 Tax=Halococcus dombrowskii TaxID=179637 RepID=A0AAV3SE47_HALDO